MTIRSLLLRCIAWSTLATGAAALCGCPSNMCLVKICKGDTSNCRCSWSTCPSGSVYDTSRETCVCEPGRVSLNGACLSIAEANTYCGRGNHYENYGCVRTVCPPGQELDLQSGTCLAKQQVDQVGQQMGVPVGANQKLGCPPGQVLVVESPQSASCVPPESACARDQVWNGRECVQLPKCQPGWILDTQKRACVPVSKEDNEAYTVQLAQWTTASYGPNGGMGSPSFCSGFSKKPITFGVLPGGAIRVVIDVTVNAPGNQVAQAQVGTSSIVEAAGAPVTPKGAAEIQQAAQEILSTLVRQGGKADLAQAHTQVRCLIVNGSSPTAVPATGGI